MDKTRLDNLYKELEFFMNNAPVEDDCTDEENDVYSEMANLKNAIENYYDSMKHPEEVKVAVKDDTVGYDRNIWKGKGVQVV